MEESVTIKNLDHLGLVASIVDAHIDSLKAINKGKLTLIADAALFIKKGLKAIKEKQIGFITRVPMKLKEAKAFISNIKPKELISLNENYRCKEQLINYGSIEQRWILYRSTHTMVREGKTAEKNLLQQSIKAAKEAKKLMQKPFYCEADAVEGFNSFKEKNNTLLFYANSIIAKPKFKSKGRPKPNIKPDHYEYYLEFNVSMAIDTLKKKTEQESGYFILATNDLSLSAQELLIQYKSQQRVERGFRFLKSPQFLSDALFLKKPQRIEAMLMIMTLCLMVYASLEYKIRKGLKEENKTFPNQLGKPIQNPTTRWIFESFFAIHVLYMDAIKKIVGLRKQHQIILQLLGEEYLLCYDIQINGNFGAE